MTAWLAYVERLEQSFTAYGIKEDIRVASFLTVIGQKTYRLLRDITSPVKPAEQPLDTLIKVLTDYLNPKPLIIAERFKFHHRDQREDESIVQYLTALRRLAETCDFQANREESLRDRLVCGMRSEATQKRLLQECDLTLKKALEIDQGQEAASKHTSELRTGKHQEVNRVTGGQPCYHCGKEGHVSDKCFFKKQSCRKCGKQGHIAKVCKQGDKKPYDKKPAYQPREKSTFKKGQHKNQFISADQPTSEEPATSQGEWGLFALFTTSDAGIKVDMELNGTNVSMILDTGASVTLISRKTWKEKFPNVKLDKSEVLLKTYSGEHLQVLGQTQMLVDYEQ